MGVKRRVKASVSIILIVFILTVGTYFVVGAVSTFLNHQYASLHDGCYPDKTNHSIVIKDNKATPSNIVANRCDRLTITNLDDSRYEMAFGFHENHVPYDSIGQQVLTKGQSLTITLIQTGTFKVHDHLQAEVQATFQVR